VADALSRHEAEGDGHLAALAAPTFKVFHDLHAETEEVAPLHQKKDEVLTSTWVTGGA
jgi:hypothetical protein